MSQERVRGFPREVADLRGSPGASGEVWARKVWEASGDLPACELAKCVSNPWRPGEALRGPGEALSDLVFVLRTGNR